MFVTATDYHTAGEPFRIVSGGISQLRGKTILEKRAFAAEHLDEIRKLLVFEPRGHADMYGCFVTEPEDDGADLGVVFFHNAGYSTACGHGTIALVTWAIESGLIKSAGAETQVVVDAPSGRLECVARSDGKSITQVRFRNVRSYVAAKAQEIDLPGGKLIGDLSYGGAFYMCIDLRSLGLRVESKNVDELIGLGRRIKAAVERNRDVVHADAPAIRDVYGIIFFETASDDTGKPLHEKNLTIFADGEVDRSPCGSGTSARLAVLHASGRLPSGRILINEGIVGERFEGRVVDEVDGGVITEISGRAFLTGFHTFVLRGDDPIGTGFLLR